MKNNMNRNKTIYLDTLGCAKNEYDSQILVAELVSRGCQMTENPEKADILIVNTCGFIQDAKVESIAHILETAQYKGKDKKLVVTGCLSERYHKDLVKEMPEVDLFVGVNDYDELPDLLLEENFSLQSKDQVCGKVEEILKYKKRLIPENSYSADLKIAEGCNNACAFCAIPRIRGFYRSKKMEDVIKEAQILAKQGIKELNIIAQDTSCYGIDLYGEYKLPELLEELCKIEEIQWIRLMYVYDDGITDELIDVIAKEKKICNYIDIPMQHISDHVLSMMRRNSTSSSIRETIKKLRKRIPDIHIRTTLLVGFPGETEEDFSELEDFVKTAKIERLGVFSYSVEEGTEAGEMDEQISEEVKVARRDRIMELQSQISAETNEQKIGKCFEVMVDEILENGNYLGRTRYDAFEIDDEVAFTGRNGHMPGDIINVKITDAYEYDLVGEEVIK